MGFDKTNCHAFEEVLGNKKYKLILLDMDGTLYYQRKMQMLMCMEMLGYALCHPFSLWKLKTISIFRKVRENAAGMEEKQEKVKTVSGFNLLQEHYKKTAVKIKKTPQEIEEVIDEWMFKRPLKYIYSCRDCVLCDKVQEWKQKGLKVVVYSDYPAEDKCKALGIFSDGIYSSDLERIGQMKPSSKAVEVILSDFGMEKEEVLVIGDRYSRDGKMAENAHVDYLILEKWRLKRKKRWK